MEHFKPKDIIRFHRMYKIQDECKIWTGKPEKSGYGRMWLQGANKLAHWVSFVLHNKKEPVGYLKHSCGNKLCVASEHIVDLGDKNESN